MIFRLKWNDDVEWGGLPIREAFLAGSRGHVEVYNVEFSTFDDLLATLASDGLTATIHPAKSFGELPVLEVK